MKQAFVLFVIVMFTVTIVEADELRDYLKTEIRYWGIQEKVSDADLDQLVDMKRKADSQGLSQQDRTQAYTALFQFVQKLRGIPEGRVPAATAVNFWAANQPLIPPRLNAAKSAQLGNVRKQGNGGTPMILIPDLGADSTVFDSFMKRNESQFTFYAVTLPGFGRTDPPRRPDKLDFATMEWWENAGTAVLQLIEKQKLRRPFILGHQAGAYLAMKLALQQPDVVRGAIVLNGLLYAAIPGIQPNATASERTRVVNSWIPAELFPNTSESQYYTVMLQNGEWFCKDKERQKELVAMIARGRTDVWWNYFAELATTDLSAEIKKLKVPMLVLPSLYDVGSVGFETSKTTLAQWKPFDRAVSSLPITVTPIEDCRAYATEDQPAKLDQEISKWTMEALKK